MTFPQKKIKMEGILMYIISVQIIFCSCFDVVTGFSRLLLYLDGCSSIMDTKNAKLPKRLTKSV